MGAGKRSNSYCTVTLFKPVPTGSPHPNPLPKGARGPFVHVERLIILLKIVKLLRSTANSQVIDFQRWLAHANRQTLPFFTADTHAVIQFQVVANHRNLLHGFDTGTNQRCAFHLKWRKRICRR